MNQSDYRDLREEMLSQGKGLREEMRGQHLEVLARFNVLESDMRQFYHLTGKLEARVDSLEKR